MLFFESLKLYKKCVNRQIEKRFYQGSPDSEEFMSLLSFQSNNVKKHRMSTVGDLLIGQLRQVPGMSVSGAEGIAAKLGSTMAQLSRKLHGMPSGAAQVGKLF